jgi:hypothetical protein
MQLNAFGVQKRPAGIDIGAASGGHGAYSEVTQNATKRCRTTFPIDKDGNASIVS